MHFTPWPFWLRIVSMATVVLPVLRSPMISSRWPRPIGVMASMALMPVCSGSETGWRPTMPGAWTSMRRVLVDEGPLPSIGSPSAFTTRPSSASPTGMKDPTGRAHDLLLFDGVDRAEHDRADRVLVEVHRQAQRAVLELEQLVHLGPGQARDARDAVADLDDPTDLLGADGRVELGHVLAQGLGDLVGANGELCHHRFLFLVISIQRRFVQVARRDGVAQRAEARARRRVQSQVADLDEDPAQQVGAVGDLQFHVLAGERRERRDEVGAALLVERSRGVHARDAPVAGAGDVVHEVVERAHHVAGPSAGDDERARRG
jgi:hypothetical protein